MEPLVEVGHPPPPLPPDWSVCVGNRNLSAGVFSNAAVTEKLLSQKNTLYACVLVANPDWLQAARDEIVLMEKFKIGWSG